MARRSAFVVLLVLIAGLGVVACVDDVEVDANAASDAGASSSGTGPVGSVDAIFNVPNGKANLDNATSCGDVTQNDVPTCPAVTTMADPDCGRGGRGPVCCPGQACVARGAQCPKAAPAFECFSPNHCTSKTCCAGGQFKDLPNTTCGGGRVETTIEMPANKGTACTCAAGDLRLCETNDQCTDGKQCSVLININIPNPAGGEGFVRRVKVCK